MSEIESGIRNKHITKYLDHYINSKINFEHAILLKGKWGSGKTFFIKEYIKNKKKNDEKEEMFYISLNGIEKLNDIYRLVVEEKYSIGKKTRVLFGGLKALNSLAKAVNVDFSKVKDDFKVEDLLKIDDKTTFIFDDIERVSSKILTSDLFGFIFREFIEKGNSKVILLSNDEELSKDDNYVKIKEKLIGKTLEVESDFESAFSIFIKGIDSKNFLDEHRGMIFQIYETSSYNNLRLLKQSIYDFDSFYFILSNQIKESNASMENLLFTFLMFSIEYKKGNIIDFEKFYTSKL